MPVKKLKDYLDNNKIKYIIISHSSAFTALEVAASAHVPGKELAKTVMVKIDGKMTMVVLPSSYKIDFDLLKNATDAKQIELATEDEFTILFPSCEIGAIPPFGNLFNMNVYVAETLTKSEQITFAAGLTSELIKLSYQDFEKLVKPTVIKISVPF